MENTEDPHAFNNGVEQVIDGPEDVVRQKTLEWLDSKHYFLVESPTNTLQNEIHPLFAKDEFSYSTPNFLERIRPARQLASGFLEDERMHGWWWDLIFREVGSEEGIDHQFLDASDHRPEDDIELATKVREHFDALATVITYREAPDDFPHDFEWVEGYNYTKERDDFILKKYNSFETFDAMDTSIERFDTLRKCLEEWRVAHQLSNGSWVLDDKPNEKLRPAILLNHMFAQYFEELSAHADRRSQMQSCQHMCGQFILAVTLVHEVCRALFYYPKIKPESFRSYGGIAEAHHDKEEAKRCKKPELGESWERFMFGGSLDFANVTVRHWDPFYRHLGEAFTLPFCYESHNLKKVGQEGKEEGQQNQDEGWQDEEQHCEDKEQRREDQYEDDVQAPQENKDGDTVAPGKLLLPMEWVAKWFREDHWSELKKLHDLQFPPTSSWKLPVDRPEPGTADGGIKSDNIRVTIVWRF